MSGQAWAPQSPDLSGLGAAGAGASGANYAPQSPDLSALSSKANNKLVQAHAAGHGQAPSSWVPQSPDIAGLQQYNNSSSHYSQPSQFSLDNGWDQQPQHHGFGPTSHSYSAPYSQPPTSYYNPAHEMAPQLRSRKIKDEDAEWKPQPVYHAPAASFPQHYQPDVKQSLVQTPQKIDTKGVEVKTKFPTARIKRIMQADEDVGKVAQVTPVVMAKALELFMISLITASADIAKSKNSKRVLVSHLKAVVMQNDQFDNLREIMEKVPDVPVKKASRDADSDSDEEGGSTKKRKKSVAAGKAKKRRGSDDDF